MELAGRYFSDLLSVEPVVDEDFPLEPFVTQGDITSRRPNRTPSPAVFVSPGPKGPGF
jgi:hypothetical protein